MNNQINDLKREIRSLEQQLAIIENEKKTACKRINY